MEVLYTTAATFKGGGIGTVESTDGILKLEIRPPKEMGGPGGPYTNPEQLFAVGYASCFANALIYAAAMKRKKVEASVTAKVSTGKNETGGFQFAVEMDVFIPDLSHRETEELIKEAHHICPYSNSIQNNVEVKFNITD